MRPHVVNLAMRPHVVNSMAKYWLEANVVLGGGKSPACKPLLVTTSWEKAMRPHVVNQLTEYWLKANVVLGGGKAPACKPLLVTTSWEQPCGPLHGGMARALEKAMRTP